ncbi:MAG: Mur ligase family protein [Pseudomonadota bacterium]
MIHKLDARRLTGLNVIWQHPSAIVDVAFDDPADQAPFIAAWESQLASMLPALDWSQREVTNHQFVGGVSLALAAPIDALYAAVEVVEWAFRSALVRLNQPLPDDDDGVVDASFDDAVQRLANLISEEQTPRLLEIADEAAEADVAFLWDDDDVSVGLGRGARCWPAGALPDSIDWSPVADVPVGLVTGTNGKTTTVRLCTRIWRAAGKHVGFSSTDGIVVDDEIIDRGDYSGPGGARSILRRPNVDIAILETARGGLLRRGLGVQRADAALITNISEDHLGDFGSQNLDELLDIKWLVMRALDQESTAVLNADDKRLVAKSEQLDCPITWFALQPDNAVLFAHTAKGGRGFSVRAGQLSRFDGERWRPICRIDDIPITLGGIARHNVANALAAAALCHALGAPDAAIAEGLQSMQVNDNAGRCNIFEIDGFEVLLDFAHNADAMAALFQIASRHPAKRRALCFGQAGDRTDREIKDLARGAWAIGLDRVMISELAAYRRGRAEREVFDLLSEALCEAGASREQISHHELERDALESALAWAVPGDLIIMLALSDATGLLQRLAELSKT